MEIKFCGAAGTVTGSAHVIVLNDGFKILLDCGLFQGDDDEMEEKNKSWGFNPSEIDVMILSHAHIDHCGRIPKLVKDGFDGKIYCTHATKDLAGIMLMDSAHIQEQDAEYESRKSGRYVRPLYTEEDTIFCLSSFRGRHYGEWFNIHEGIDVLFQDAGHILGSASVVLSIQEGKKKTLIGFSGDIGRLNRPILKDPVPMIPVDYLICESTYGGQEHEDAPTENNKLLKIIFETCIENQGKLIIPAFSVGRTQELIFKMHMMAAQGKLPDIPVFVDSPLATSATEIFRKHPECFDEETFERIKKDSDPFGLEHLRFTKSVEESKKLNMRQDPCIIISASGMAQAGRIKHHIFNNIDKPQNTILIVGYCAPGTLGNTLMNQPEKVKIFGKEVTVKAKIESLTSMSAHADQSEIVDFLKNQDGSHVKLYLVHGERKKQHLFQLHLENIGYQHIFIPEYRQSMFLS
jgi:metallo-beta-lactamase family protein